MKSLASLYKNLSDKDQRALKILAATLAPLLLYFLIVNPSISYYLSAKQNYTDNQALLDWINENTPKVATASKAINTVTNEPLLQVISTSAEASNLKLSRLQPEGSNQTRIWLNETEFTALTHWLSDLVLQSGLTITSISIDKTSRPGIVNAQCLLAKENRA